MVKVAKANLLGSWAFLIGVVIAVLVGLGSYGLGLTLSATVVAILALLGLIIGLLAVSAKEVEPFVLASIAILLAAYIGMDVMALVKLGGVLEALIALVVPAAVVVALKEVFSIAKK